MAKTWARTVAQLTTRILYKAKDPDATNLVAAESLGLINEAERAIFRRVAALNPEFFVMTGLTTSSIKSLAANTASYDVPTDIYQMIMVSTLASTGATEATIRNGLSLERTKDPDADGYYIKTDKIYLYPTPTAAVTNGLIMEYVPIPTAHTATTETVPLSDWFEDAIVEYVVLQYKARQEEKVADFAQFYKMVQDSVDALVAKTNASDKENGLRVGWRHWI